MASAIFNSLPYQKMAIEQKVRQMEELFNHLDKEITAFKSETCLHCFTGCGKIIKNDQLVNFNNIQEVLHYTIDLFRVDWRISLNFFSI